MRRIIGKKAKLVFQDNEKVLVKEGTIIQIDGNFTMIDLGTKIELIPTQRILRIEVMKGGKD